MKTIHILIALVVLGTACSTTHEERVKLANEHRNNAIEANKELDKDTVFKLVSADEALGATVDKELETIAEKINENKTIGLSMAFIDFYPTDSTFKVLDSYGYNIRLAPTSSTHLFVIDWGKSND